MPDQLDRPSPVNRPGKPAGHRARFSPAPSRPSYAILDDRVRAGEHQRDVTVIETHQVRPLPAGSPDLDDLASPPRMTHDVGVHVKAIPDGCLHAPTSASAFADGMFAFPAVPDPEDTAHDVPRLARACIRGHAAGSHQPSEAFAFGSWAVPHLHVDEPFMSAVARPRSRLAVELGAKQERVT
jgi:hypothetical protein